MNRVTLMLLAALSAMLLVAGAAFAADTINTIRCKDRGTCVGTRNADKMIGDPDEWRQAFKGRGGDDPIYPESYGYADVKAGDGNDTITGGRI